MTAPRPWLSIVTVVKDDPSGFAATRASIEAQELEGVQWIVIDGSDPRQGIDNPAEGLDVACLWEAPAGVYPAMNTGLNQALGEYVYFLNAGDRLHASTTLRDVRELLGSSPVWLVGQVRFEAEDGTSIDPSPLDYAREQRRLFAAGRFPPHQGTIMRTEVLREIGGFDTTYRIAADYDAALAFSRVSAPLTTPLIIANFAIGGISTHQWQRALGEFHRARVRRLGLHGIQRAEELAWTAGHAVATSLSHVNVRMRAMLNRGRGG